MITCVVHYVVDPEKIEAFERFAERWMELVDRHGGQHHGYFLRPRARATQRSRCSASRASPPTSSTAAASGPTPTSSPRTGSGTRAAA